jgi:hypothetical protein
MSIKRSKNPLAVPVWSPVYEPFPVPALANADDEPTYCAVFSKALLPYILGALEIWTYTDAFVGTEQEKKDAVALFRELQYFLGKGGCMSISDIRIDGCNLQVQVSGSEEWVTVGDLTDCAVPGPQGPQGAQGEPGEQGIDGNSANAPEPITTATGDERNQQACAMAQGYATWLRDKCVSAVEIIQQAAILAKSIADQITDLLDALPIFGPLVNNLIDLANDMAAKGDYGDIIDHLRTVEFMDELICQYYCRFKSMPQIGIEQIRTANLEVAGWAALLLPGAPFATLYGQAFALYLLTVDPAVAWKRAFLHDDERSDDCETLCADCQDTIVDFTYITGSGPASVAIDQEFTITPEHFSNFGEYEIFQFTCSQTCTIQWIERTLQPRERDSIVMEWTGTGGTRYQAGQDGINPFSDFAGLAALNTHKGEQHQCAGMQAWDNGTGTFTLKLVSIP